MNADQRNVLAKIQLSMRINDLLEKPSIYIKDSYTDDEIANIADYLLRHGIPCPTKLPASPSQRLQVMQMMARAWIGYEVLDAICNVMGDQPTSPHAALPGELVKCTYEGLPLEFEEWDDLYVVGNIPADIWDEIRDKHEEHMKGNPSLLSIVYGKSKCSHCGGDLEYEGASGHNTCLVFKCKKCHRRVRT